jgi:hypothetical protein
MIASQANGPTRLVRFGQVTYQPSVPSVPSGCKNGVGFSWMDFGTVISHPILTLHPPACCLHAGFWVFGRGRASGSIAATSHDSPGVLGAVKLASDLLDQCKHLKSLSGTPMLWYYTTCTNAGEQHELRVIEFVSPSDNGTRSNRGVDDASVVAGYLFTSLKPSGRFPSSVPRS